MKIAVVGTGYVGLVTGTCLAETGNTVICVDIDAVKVEKMKSGIVPIYEPHLDIIFERNIKQNRLKFTTNLKEALDVSDIIFLALPTPPDEDGSADLSYILGVSKEIGKIINSYKVIVDKSTVPVGTAGKVRETILKSIRENSPSLLEQSREAGSEPQRLPGSEVLFDVVSNPEFLREGFAVDDFMKPDRVVIGTSSEKAKKLMSDLFSPYVRQGNPIIFMDERSAELTKYAANSFLATKISFMNEIANLCEILGANVDNVRAGMGSDTRIGKRFLFPGIGYGGSCFPKDVQALVKSATDVHYDFKILKSVMKVNEIQRLHIIPKIKEFFNNNLEGKNIAVWGLAFKPDTDDIREAPALYIIDELLKEGAKIYAYDPEAMDNVKKIFGEKISYSYDQYDCLKNADCLLICTEWSVFRTPDFDKVNSLLNNKVVFDGRNLYSPEAMKEMGYCYYSIGRETVKN